MELNDIVLKPLTNDDREQFVSDNQEAFNYGALEEFGRRTITLKKTNRSSPAIPSFAPLTAAKRTEYLIFISLLDNIKS